MENGIKNFLEPFKMLCFYAEIFHQHFILRKSLLVHALFLCILQDLL